MLAPSGLPFSSLRVRDISSKRIEVVHRRLKCREGGKDPSLQGMQITNTVQNQSVDSKTHTAVCRGRWRDYIGIRVYKESRAPIPNSAGGGRGNHRENVICLTALCQL